MHHWSRERELAADAGSRIAGTESSALALLRISGLHRIVDAALGTTGRRRQRSAAAC